MLVAFLSIPMVELIQVRAPHFTAGVVAYNGVIRDVPPILKWSKGWLVEDFGAYCQLKNWEVKLVGTNNPPSFA